jgi:hypothetical protein
MSHTPGTSTGSAGRSVPSADPSCAEFRRKTVGIGFAAGSCGSLTYWNAPRAARDGYRAAEIAAQVIRGGDGLAGLVTFMPNELDGKPQLEVYRFDGAGECQQRIGRIEGSLADARYDLLAALERGGSNALQIACIAAQPCSQLLLWNGRALDSQLAADGGPRVQRIAITRTGRLLLVSYSVKPAMSMPEIDVLAPAEQQLDLRLFDAEGLLVRQVVLPAPGRLIAIAISEDDQLFVLSDEQQDAAADAGTPSRAGSRIDRFDVSLLARASWRAPASVQLRALDVNAGGQLAIAGSIDEPLRAWVHVLNAANWSDYWPAPVVSAGGGAFALQIQPGGEVLAFGSATPADVWLMRYARGQGVWPTAKAYRSADQTPGRAIELRSAVQAQSDGSILASGYAAVGYCD